MKIALIAGETSGDQLGGWLMQALKRQREGLQFMGIGGPRMQEQGLSSFFPMQELSLFGFFEVFPHVQHIRRRLQQTIEWIEREQPDRLVTIDVPGFTLRVVKALRERQIFVPRSIHYVAPSVWAYKANRARLIAQRVDLLLTLLPFEPPYFTRQGLAAEFIGHEIAWQWREKGDGHAFRARQGIAENAPLLAVFPGSRHGELQRLLPIYEQAIAQFQRKLPTLRVVIQVPTSMIASTLERTKHWAQPPLVIGNQEEKKDFFAASTAALVKSGTIALECALAELPAVVTYRTNSMTALLLRHTLKIPYVSLANILLKREVVPELLQQECSPHNIVSTLLPLLEHEAARAQQRAALAPLPALLGAEDATSPSDKAAALILA